MCSANTIDGPEHAQAARLPAAAGMNSNQAYHTYTKRATKAAQGIDKAEKAVAWFEAQLATAKERLANHRHEQSEAQRLLKELEPRLFFAPKLPGCVLLSILGQLGKKAGQRAACVQREWQGSVATAKRMGMYDIKAVSLEAGFSFTVVCSSAGAVFTFGGFRHNPGEELSSVHPASPFLGHGEVRLQPVPRLVEALGGGKTVIGASAGVRHTAVWTDAGELFMFGYGHDGRLGHGGTVHEHVPRLVQALAGKQVLGASSGENHTAVWTDAGELFTFGYGQDGRLGHGGTVCELVPRRVEALAGKQVLGASAGRDHTAVWTDAGELFTFGYGHDGRLGHGGTVRELVPRRVEALAGKQVLGASAGGEQTAVWTDAGELFTFGDGRNGRLGHGGTVCEFVPRRVEALAGKKVLGASSGLHHTAVWTDAGELFTFGVGLKGRLGHGGEANESVPRRVEALQLAGKQVLGASAGRNHTAVWTDARELFTFGWGGHGQLGHGGFENEYVPRLLELPMSTRA